MWTTQTTIRELLQVGVLKPNGLALGRLHVERKIKSQKDLERVTTRAIIWEVARRYNLTYRIRTDGRWVFPSIEAYYAEAEWFAQKVMREWSGHALEWLPAVHAPPLPEAPEREGRKDDKCLGAVPWLDNQPAYMVYKRLHYHIHVNGAIYDSHDIDPYIYDRKYATPEVQIELGYWPLIEGHYQIEIAPTALEAPSTARTLMNKKTFTDSDLEEDEDPTPAPTPDYDINIAMRRRHYEKLRDAAKYRKHWLDGIPGFDDPVSARAGPPWLRQRKSSSSAAAPSIQSAQGLNTSSEGSSNSFPALTLKTPSQLSPETRQFQEGNSE